MARHITITVFFLLLSGLGKIFASQYSDTAYLDTLLDNATRLKFIISNNRQYVTAINIKGRILWRSIPLLDRTNKLPGKDVAPKYDTAAVTWKNLQQKIKKKLFGLRTATISKGLLSK